MALSAILQEKTTRRNRLHNACEEILNGVDADKRNLKPEEEGRYNALTQEMDAITFTAEERIELAQEEIRSRDTAARIFNSSGPREESASPVLTRSQSMADVVSGEGRDLSIGKYIRGAVTGNWDNAHEERDMAIGTLSAGGYLVPSPLSATVIDRARALTRVLQAGGVVVPMNAQTLRVAKIVGDPTYTWRNEAATIPTSDITLGAVDFSAKSVSTIIKFSRELMEDSANLDAVVTEAIAGSLAVELDRVALFGLAANHEPTGLFNVAGLTKTAAGANGGAVSFPLMYGAVSGVLTANYQPSAFIHSPRTEIAIAQLSQGTTGVTIAGMPILKDIPRLYTSTVPNNQVQGTANNASTLFVGQFDKLMIGMRTELIVEVLRERYADTGEMAAFVWSRVDVQVVDTGAFQAVVGINA